MKKQNKRQKAKTRGTNKRQKATRFIIKEINRAGFVQARVIVKAVAAAS